MSRVPLTIKGLSYSQTQSGAYALILGEEEGVRRLPIIIGGFEAQSIAIALEKEVNPPRPLTHDLFKNLADHFAIGLKEVIIHKLQDGVFFSSLVFVREGKEEVVDARTSDAVALAVRFSCPIFTYEEILEKAGIILDEENPSAPAKKASSPAPRAPRSAKSNTLEALSMEELNRKLDEAVANEDYERAAQIRDEISKREK